MAGPDAREHSHRSAGRRTLLAPAFGMPALPPHAGTRESARREMRSQHLMHVDAPDARRVDVVGAAAEPMNRFSISQRYFSLPVSNFGTGAEIDQFRVDRFAALQLLQQFDRAEAKALVLDIDHRAVVGLERVFRLELDQLIGPDDLKVGAERADLAVDPLAADLAAE